MDLIYKNHIVQNLHPSKHLNFLNLTRLDRDVAKSRELHNQDRNCTASDVGKSSRYK